MAEATLKNLEREYTIPLRKHWMKKSSHKKTRASVMAVKKFIARHMKVADRNLDNVRLDNYLNNELWARGGKTPLTKIKVIAKREGDVVRVELAEMPDKWKFEKIKHDRRHKKSDKKVVEKKEEKEEKTDEEKKDEKEKEKSVAVAGEKQMEMQAKADKHVSKGKAPEIRRLALKK